MNQIIDGSFVQNGYESIERDYQWKNMKNLRWKSLFSTMKM